MSPAQIYETLFEFYDYAGEEYDYSIFNGRIAYQTIVIKTCFASNDINIMIGHKQIYVGNIAKAPFLSPVNILVEYGRLYGKKSINVFCQKVMKVYKNEYSLNAFLNSNLSDVVNYSQRLYCGRDESNLFNYDVALNKLGNKVLAELHYTNLKLDNFGKIINHSKLKQQCSLSTVSELLTMQPAEIFEVLIEQAAVSNDGIMRQLRPYLRKCAIDEILRTL